MAISEERKIKLESMQVKESKWDGSLKVQTQSIYGDFWRGSDRL